jgi:hypothetical protein
MLLRSQKPETRASGLYRLDKWHTSGGFGPISPALSHSALIVAQAAAQQHTYRRPPGSHTHLVLREGGWPLWTDGARQAFVNGDGIEVLLTSLSATRDVPTANLVLRLLGDLLRFEGAPERLRAPGRAATARAACGALRPAGEDARCLELAADLERALQAA